MNVSEIKKQALRHSSQWLWWMGRHAFLAILAATIFTIGLGACLYYYYVALPARASMENGSIMVFQQANFDQVLADRRKAVAELEAKTTEVYNDPFK